MGPLHFDEADRGDDGAPSHLTYGSDEELERILIQRIEDPGESIEATPEFRADLKRRAAERRQ